MALKAFEVPPMAKRSELTCLGLFPLMAAFVFCLELALTLCSITTDYK